MTAETYFISALLALVDVGRNLLTLLSSDRPQLRRPDPEVIGLVCEMVGMAVASDEVSLSHKTRLRIPPNTVVFAVQPKYSGVGALFDERVPFEGYIDGPVSHCPRLDCPN